ncbi:MAG TPA: DUF503 domain-containing protein [Thermoanaerobaculia bacterium]
MIVGVVLFEIHIPQAQSLKEKRMVVRSLRDRLRNKFDMSVAEVGWNDLHQRARLGASIVSNDEKTIRSIFASIAALVESEGEAQLIGWTAEMIDFDADGNLGIPGQTF